MRQLDPRAGLGLLLVVGIASLVFGLWKTFLVGIVVMGEERTTAGAARAARAGRGVRQQRSIELA